jgi:hypothetical protein
MKCPCEGCIVWIFCRQQRFAQFRFCEDLSNFLGFRGKKDQEYPLNIEMHMTNYPIFYKCLKPIKWRYKHWPKDHKFYKKTYRINHK